jgi:hypothetical protein
VLRSLLKDFPISGKDKDRHSLRKLIGYLGVSGNCWDQAGLQVYWQSLEVIQYARWYLAQRVERALNRAISHGVGGLDDLRFILEQQQNRYSEHPDAELAAN